MGRVRSRHDEESFMTGKLHLEESRVSHPGYSAAYGATGPRSYVDPPKQFFGCRYDDAPKGEITTRHFGFADTLDEAKEIAHG